MFGGIEIVVGLAVFALIASMSPDRVRRIYGHTRRALSKPSFHAQRQGDPTSIPTPVLIKSVRVIDGDTVEDRHTRIRYRIENIDAPETGENAKCYRERFQGEIATRVARKLFAQASQVVARPIGRNDVYGRTVARFELDGQDFGTIMIQRGFARPWAGQRESWCGPQGGLAALARARSAEWKCKTCQAWKSRPGNASQPARFVSVAADPVGLEGAARAAGKSDGFGKRPHTNPNARATTP